MTLLETAEKINAALAAKKQADDAFSRKKCKFDAFITDFWSNLFEIMSNLSNEFNANVQDSGKHIYVENLSTSEMKVLRICWKNMKSDDSNFHFRDVQIDSDQLRLHVIDQKSSAKQDTYYRSEVSRKNGISFVLPVGVSRTVFCEDEGRKMTGDIFVDLRQVTDMVPTQHNAYELADFLLDSFVNRK